MEESHRELVNDLQTKLIHSKSNEKESRLLIEEIQRELKITQKNSEKNSIEN